jgi:hypothetical protein
MFLRLLGYCFLCLAVAALAYDGMRMIADNGRLAFTTLEMHWLAISPSSMEAARAALDSVSSLIWTPFIITILILPAWIVAAGLGCLFYLAGYQRPRVLIPDGI